MADLSLLKVDGVSQRASAQASMAATQDAQDAASSQNVTTKGAQPLCTQ